MNITKLFKKKTSISHYMIDKHHDINALLYRHFISKSEILKDEMYEYGVRNVDKKVGHINDGGRFYLEDIGKGFAIFVEEKDLPTTRKEIQEYNIKVRPKNLRLITRKLTPLV